MHVFGAKVVFRRFESGEAKASAQAQVLLFMALCAAWGYDDAVSRIEFGTQDCVFWIELRKSHAAPLVHRAAAYCLDQFAFIDESVIFHKDQHT